MINQRAQHLLTELIENYIQEGQPVGSKALASTSALSLSAASIRNIMGDLEQAGFIRAPHTSAGRIPTVSGYRFFVDSLLTKQAQAKLNQKDFNIDFGNAQVNQQMVSRISGLVSEITQLAGLVTLPKHERMILRQVEFIDLSNKRILVILVLNEQEVQNRVINVEREFTASELEQAGNYLTQHFGGMPLEKVRDSLVAAIKQDQKQMQWAADAIVSMADDEKNRDKTDNYVLSGQSKLINSASETGLEQLRDLFDAFTQKREILHLLDQCIDSQGIQIFIGEESGYDVLDSYSIVTAPYTLDGDIVGVLGVIGPQRMAYDKAITTVNVAAKLLSDALKS